MLFSFVVIINYFVMGWWLAVYFCCLVVCLMDCGMRLLVEIWLWVMCCLVDCFNACFIY